MRSVPTRERTAPIVCDVRDVGGETNVGDKLRRYVGGRNAESQAHDATTGLKGQVGCVDWRRGRERLEWALPRLPRGAREADYAQTIWELAEAIEHTAAVLDSVTIVSLDPDGILGRLRATARLLRNGQNEVDSAWLFGSLVKGDVVPGSDADLVVLFKDSDRPRHECLTDGVGAFSGVGIGVEALFFIQEEIDHMGADGNSLFRSILERRLSQ